MIDFFLPNLFERNPKTGFPIIEPIDIYDPTHDISWMVIGPVTIGELSDSKIGKFDDGQPQTAPKPKVLKLAENKMALNRVW